MSDSCAACKGDLGNLVRVTVNGEFFEVCSFACKDTIIGNRNQDIGCGIIEGGKVRDVNMCSECALSSMPFVCFTSRQRRGKTFMVVGYGKEK